MSTFQMYIFVMSDNFKSAFCALATICGILSIINLIILFPAYLDSMESHDRAVRDGKDSKSTFQFFNMLKVSAKSLIVVFIVSFISTTILPNTKQLAAIYVVPKLINSEVVQQMPDLLTELAKDWIEELKPAQKDKGAK